MTGNTASIFDRRFRKWSGTPLEKQRGVIYCGRCGQKYEGDFARAHGKFKEHLRDDHPEIKPRLIAEIRRDLERQAREAKKKREKEEEVVKAASARARPVLSKPRGERTPYPVVQQPEFTDEMVERAADLYREIGSLERMAARHHTDFGFPSAKSFKRVLSKNLREHGIPIRDSGSRCRLTEERITEAVRLCEIEGLSVWYIAKQYHESWGYSSNGLRNTLYWIFKKRGVNFRQATENGAGRKLGRQYKMTPERVGVTWHLYSVGNYHIREITEIAREAWGYLGIHTLDRALRRAGYKLRASKWDNDGSRPISRREALKLIKSVG